MAHSAYSTSSVIPFDTGRSYVVRSLPLERSEYRFEDHMGRTDKDKIFLRQFETIFLAASKGDLATCKEVVDKGFRDFNAYSVGRFGTTDNVRLDQVSPLKIAQDRGHTKVVEFFKKFMDERNSPQAHVAELDPYFQQLDDCMKNFIALNLNLQPAPPKVNEILEQSSDHVFLKKPNRIQINEEGVTRYASSQKIEVLIEELKEKGPLIGLGDIGPGCYVDDPRILEGKFDGEDTYGWKLGATRKEGSKKNYLLILGAKKIEDRGLVYFVLSQDVTTNQDSYTREHKPSNGDKKIYAVSHKTFRDYLLDLYPCGSI